MSPQMAPAPQQRHIWIELRNGPIHLHKQHCFSRSGHTNETSVRNMAFRIVFTCSAYFLPTCWTVPVRESGPCRPAVERGQLSKLALTALVGDIQVANFLQETAYRVAATTVRTDFRNSKLVSFSLARQAKAPSIADWQAYAGPVLTDPTGMVNLLAETPFSALDLVSCNWHRCPHSSSLVLSLVTLQLRYEAKLTLRMLKRGDANGFEQVLLCKMDQPHLRFDQLARYAALCCPGVCRH